MDEQVYSTASELIKRSGLNPNDFCTVRNGCFNRATNDCKSSKGLRDAVGLALTSSPSASASTTCSSNDSFPDEDRDPNDNAPFWYLGQKFFQATGKIGAELADWFEDPALLSDWLVSQQEHGLLNKPLVSQQFSFIQCS